MSDELVAIYVRFANDGSVAEISQRPEGFSPQQWFNALSDAVVADQYRALSGGRGLFRVSPALIESARAKGAGAAAA